jgi:type II secretory pathway pseudopilin PulG
MTGRRDNRANRLRLCRDEGGFTLIEGLVAGLILTIGAIAVLTAFDASARNTFRAEEQQVAVNRAQQELEEIRGLDYLDVALTTTPATSTDPDDPRNRVSGNDFEVDRGVPASDAEMVVRNIGDVTQGTISPGPTPFESGDVSGKIYRYVVWQNDPKCLLVCPGSHDFKRVIVIVKLDEAAISNERPYVEVQTEISDPDATTLSSTDPGSGGAVLTAQQFFLSDTTCNHAARQDITADHNQHQTLGQAGVAHCDATNPQKPDTLFTGAPPDPDPENPNDPALFDYAIDIEPATGGANDKGLQLLRQEQNGCSFTGGTNPQYRIHRWLSQPLDASFDMSGQGTLRLNTRTINDVQNQGSICVFVFVRTEVTELGVTTTTDTPLIDLTNPPNPYFVFTKNPWQHGSWKEERFVMQFSPTTAQAGQRIGLGLAVRRNNTSGDYLQFMYDHPDFPSRLELQTTTPIG